MPKCRVRAAPSRSPEKEESMFEVTDKASEMIKEFLNNRDGIQAIRILMAGGG